MAELLGYQPVWSRKILQAQRVYVAGFGRVKVAERGVGSGR